MNTDSLHTFCDTLIRHQVRRAMVVWGPPGVGKSSVVKAVADTHGFDMIDLRLSQLAPTDLRGLPVPENGIARWYPPEFLPREGTGILFLDELNMAPPAMQGVAQQLILDRRIGSYVVPAGWYVWAAANRKEDRAAVFDMPAPLANRFLHVSLDADLECFKRYALARALHPHVVAFLSQHPTKLHAFDATSSAWPSPRSWEMASDLLWAGLSVEPAVGDAVAIEFAAFLRLIGAMPDLDAIIAGGTGTFPSEPSAAFATTLGLVSKATDAPRAVAAMRWMHRHAPAEWIQRFVADLMPYLGAHNLVGVTYALAMQDPALRDTMADMATLLRSE